MVFAHSPPSAAAVPVYVSLRRCGCLTCVRPTASSAGRYRRVQHATCNHGERRRPVPQSTPLHASALWTFRIQPIPAQCRPVPARRPRRDAASAHRCQQALLHGCTRCMLHWLVRTVCLFVAKSFGAARRCAQWLVDHSRHGCMPRDAAWCPCSSGGLPHSELQRSTRCGHCNATTIYSLGRCSATVRPAGGLATAGRRTAHQWRICGREYGGVWRMLRCSISTSPTQRSFRSARCTTGESTHTRSAQAHAAHEPSRTRCCVPQGYVLTHQGYRRRSAAFG